MIIEQTLRKEELRKNETIRTLKSKKTNLAQLNSKLQKQYKTEIINRSSSQISKIEHAIKQEINYKNKEI